MPRWMPCLNDGVHVSERLRRPEAAKPSVAKLAAAAEDEVRDQVDEHGSGSAPVSRTGPGWSW